MITNSNRIRRFLISSCLILIIISSVFSVLLITTVNTNRNIKVMTWNISGAVGTDDNFDVDRIIDKIKANNPDIIGLQEVDGQVEIKDLADELDMYYFYAKAGDTNEGNVLLSKFPIKDVEVFNLPLIDGERPRIIVKGTVVIDHLKWDIYVSHFSRYDKPIDHYNQARLTASLIEKNRYYELY
ncbi:MAG: endonuclease/exonuclease/phosphatase family protein [Candidatus Hermodarchaeota archaeon]